MRRNHMFSEHGRFASNLQHRPELSLSFFRVGRSWDLFSQSAAAAGKLQSMLVISRLSG
jgi:hypothetical protein